MDIGSTSRTTQNHYFVASEHGPGAWPRRGGRRGQRRGSEGPHNGPYYFGPSERNKIKILLR